MKTILILLQKEATLEWRNKSSLNGLLLYALMTVFLVFFSIKYPDPVTWMSLLWIILLFASINAMAKSFVQERSERWIYFYTICSSQEMIISKLVYNFLLMLILGITCLGLHSLFSGFPVIDVGYFSICLLLGLLCFTLLFTFMGAIAAKANRNSSLIAILSFPIAIPMLSFIINFAKKTIAGQQATLYTGDIVLLGGLDLLLLALGIILFQYSWRE